MSSSMDDLNDFPPFPLPEEVDPFIQGLVDVVGGMTNLNMAVQTAASHGIVQMSEWGIKDGESFLRYASGLLKWLPTETVDGKEIYDVLCVFGFIFDQPPLGGQQNPINPLSIGVPLSSLSKWLVDFAVKIGEWMDQPHSLTSQTVLSFWQSPKYNMQEAVTPPGGWKNFNDLFSRKLKPGSRPIASPEDDKVITWPADATFDGAWPVNDKGIVSIKNIDWPISALLHGSDYADQFAGGMWTHSFLNTTDYHRQHAPVSGKVLEARVIQGQCYMEIDVVADHDGKTIVKPHRSWTPKESDVERGQYGALDAPDNAGYQFLQTRGLIVFENPVLGLVAFLPVGMSQVSSVKLSVNVGDEVTKGDEVSYFQFGGSDYVMVFQSKTNVDLSSVQMGQHYNVGNVLATAVPH